MTALLYRAPQSLSYQWTLDGDDIAGKTSETTTASTPGDYRCVVTAHNAAGGTSQTSDPHTVVPDVPPNDFTLGELKRNKHNGTAKLGVIVPASGNLQLEQGKKVELVDENVSAGTTRLAVEPRGRTAQVLLHKGSVDLDPVVTFTPDWRDSELAGQAAEAGREATLLTLRRQRPTRQRG